MEKNTPHCKLVVVKKLIEDGRVSATYSALSGGAALEMSFEEMLHVVLKLSSNDFHKSMTTYDNHRVWQDVYRSVTARGVVYLKLAVIDDVLIVSFKEA
jgi:motility quorum-sensing regulator / GCU-specific mRNA interferase toxin